MKKNFVISVGGSLLVPEQISIDFVKKFGKLIRNRVAKGDKFILIIGGGHTCRNYQQALAQTKKASARELDLIGIATTWVNAELVRLYFGELAHPVIVKNPNKRVSFRKSVLIAGGWEPGRTTDDDAVRLAKQYGAKTVINLSNIDYLYTKDPKKHKDAQKVEFLDWKYFIKIIGPRRVPGGNYPFDPVAAKLAEKTKLQVIIANGKNLKNLKNILSGKRFRGTTIG